MDYCETKNILKRVEVTVAMQERVPFLQAKRGDQAINCLAYREPVVPQNLIVASGGDRQLYSGHVEYSEIQHVIPDALKLSVLPDTLQDFAED